MKTRFLLALLGLGFPLLADAQNVVDAITIEARVDGPSSLHIRPKSIYWENGYNAKPGRIDLLDEPTYVNGETWTPRWKEQKSDRGADKSLPFGIDINTADLEFELISVTKERGQTGIETRTPIVARREGGEFVVNIPDSESGDRWYKFIVRRAAK